MQSVSGLTTRLLTLSVHDSLTFDGVEIAINPDIFSSPTGRHSRDTSSYTHSRDTSHASSIPILTPIVPPSPLITNPTHGNSSIGGSADEYGRFAKTPSLSSMETPGVGVPGYVPKFITSFQAGDIIEIKVWDKKNHQEIMKNSNNSRSGLKQVQVPVQSQIQENVLSKAALQLQQQISQQQGQQEQQQRLSPFVSLFHPLSNQSNSFEKPGKGSTRPPIVPRSSSSQKPSPVPSPQKTAGVQLNSERENTLDSIPSQGILANQGDTAFVAEDRMENGNNPSPSNNNIPPKKETIAGSTSQYMNIISKQDPTHSRISSLGSFTGATGDSIGGVEDDPLEQISATHNMRLKFVVAVTGKSLTALKAGGRTQISILRKVADLHELSSYDMVTITKIDKGQEEEVKAMYQADFVTLTVKDQFISRGEMFQFQNSFQGKWIYSGERLCTAEGIRGTVMEIRQGDEEKKSGFITEDTKITFRTRSARIIWLVQLSSEMWSYASPYEAGGSRAGTNHDAEVTCEIYFDKFVSFMYRLFEEWKELEVTHSLTVVFFSRTYMSRDSNNKSVDLMARQASAGRRDADGRLYEDHYKVVVENQTTDWDTLVTKIKKSFVSFPSEVEWKLSSSGSRLPSVASQGNILEAINTALNMLQLHYVDRDLHRCGNSVVVVSAGSGVFEVDGTLAGITKQRMVDYGIGSDMLSLGLPPLHVAPFMLYKGAKQSEERDFDDRKVFSEIPHWMHLSFVNYDRVDPKSSQANKSRSQGNENKSLKFKTASNGFIVHKRKPVVVSPTKRDGNRNNNLTDSENTQRHLILGRDFEDILEACRPRNRGVTSGGIPPALLSQLKLFGLTGTKSESTFENIHTEVWGSLQFDDKQLSPVRISGVPSVKYPTRNSEAMAMLKRGSGSDLSSHSTASSNFTTNLSFILGRSPMNIHHSSPTLKIVQIQQNSSARIPLVVTGESSQLRNNVSQDSLLEEEIKAESFIKIRKERKPSIASAASLSTHGHGGKKLSIAALKKAMTSHDNNIFSSESADTNLESRPGKRKSRAQQPGSRTDGVITPMPTRPSEEGGIGAAISQYTATISQHDRPNFSTPMQPTRSESFAVTTLKRSMNAVSSTNLRHNHTMNLFSNRPHSLGMQDDAVGIDPAIGLNVSRHNVGLGLSPSPHQSSFLPFDFSHQYNRNQKSITAKENPNAIDEEGPLDSTSPQPPLPKEEISPDRIISNQDRQTKGKPKKKPISVLKNVKSAQAPPRSNHQSRRKPWVLNPFRQEDEEEVLAEKTHNSRRWSHVFPQGETEFKRHAGPNWKSLCQPAILPVTIDVHPTQQELNDLNLYSFNHYEINLDAMDLTYYNSHSELLMEMVRQRIVQDFQVVPQNVLSKSRRPTEHKFDKIMQRPTELDWIKETESSQTKSSNDEIIQHTLSMGHRVHIISYNPQSESVKVVSHLARSASNRPHNTYSYQYNIWMPITQRYQKVSQTFQRYPEEYPWNRLDNLICGDPDRTLSANTRFRRIAFCIIPDRITSSAGEDEIVKKIKRFLDFIGKLAKKDLGIKITSSASRPATSQHPHRRRPVVGTSMTHFILHVAKKSRNNEWLEMAVDKVFDTRSSFRLIFKWLVASAIKVDSQVQMLQRRCVQFGLCLVNVPYLSSESNLLLHPLRRPENTQEMNPEKAKKIEKALLERFNFCNDGKHIVYPKDVENGFGIRIATEGQVRVRRVAVQQYLHRSGTMFIRLLHGVNKFVMFVLLENRLCTGSNQQLQDTFLSTFAEVTSYIDLVNQEGTN